MTSALRRVDSRIRFHFSLGAYGERSAQRYLKRHGYHLRHVNWRCEIGELDIVAQDKSTLVIIEVKTRRKEIAEEFIPESAVDEKKQRKLTNLAAWYREDYQRELSYKRIRQVRFDVIAITQYTKKGFRRSEIKHIKRFF